MAIPSFVLGGSSLSFQQGIQLPSNTPLKKIQALDRTAGGTLQVENLGAQFQRFVLNFINLPKAKYSELVVWFDFTANGAVNSFTYSDETGASYTVRIITDELNFLETRNGFLTGELLLEVV